MEDFRAASEPSARKQASVSVAVDYVITNEGLAVTSEELLDYYERNAARLNITPEEVRNQMGGDETVAERLLQNRANQLIRDSVKVIEKQVEKLD